VILIVGGAVTVLAACVFASGKPERSGAPSVRSSGAELPLNTVPLGGQVYLRAIRRRSATAHLAVRLPPEEQVRHGRPAAHRPRIALAEPVQGYAASDVWRPDWCERTMCGLPWTAMQRHEAEIDAALLGLDGLGNLCPICVSRALHPASPASG
jgi:hypothetical protein